MKKLILVLLVVLCYAEVDAQVYGNISQGPGRAIVRGSRSALEDVEGSPFLIADWIKGSAKLSDGVEVNGEYKYDILNDELMVKTEKGEEGVYPVKVNSFYLMDGDDKRFFRRNFTSSDYSKDSFFEVLGGDKTLLLKKYLKNIVESKGYNSATVTKKITDREKWYIAKADGSIAEVKLAEKSILEVLNKEQLASYVKSNKLNLKKATDIVTLLKYYDTL